MNDSRISLTMLTEITPAPRGMGALTSSFFVLLLISDKKPLQNYCIISFLRNRLCTRGRSGFRECVNDLAGRARGARLWLSFNYGSLPALADGLGVHNIAENNGCAV